MARVDKPKSDMNAKVRNLNFGRNYLGNLVSHLFPKREQRPGLKVGSA
jgi:hypothetical protein